MSLDLSTIPPIFLPERVFTAQYDFTQVSNWAALPNGQFCDDQRRSRDYWPNSCST